MRWPWVSRELFDFAEKCATHTREELHQAWEQLDAVTLELNEKRGQIGLLRREAEQLCQHVQELTEQREQDKAYIRQMETNLTSERADSAHRQKIAMQFESDLKEARAQLSHLQKKLDSQPNPGFNPRPPRFHGPNGIAAQLEAAAAQEKEGRKPDGV